MRRSQKLPPLVLLLSLLPVALTAQRPPDDASARQTVDSLAHWYLALGQAPGFSVEVVRGADTLVKAGYGTADLEQDVAAGPETLYRIGSITKQFTSASVMRLVEAGRVRLDDSVAAYVRGLPASWRRVTVRQLLNHTSGVPSYTDIGGPWRRRWREDMPPDTLVALTAHDTVWFAPGTDWRYDNTGYVLLGMLLDAVTGMPYPRYVEEKLVRPLGLEHTWYCDVDRILPDRAPGYQKTPAGWIHAPYLSMTQPYSAGALCSTVGDLARWNGLLATGHVVSPASYRAMTTPTGAATKRGYGFGLVADTLAGHRIIQHGGGIPGFITANAYLPDDSVSVTVLTNSGNANPDLLLEPIVRVMLGLPLRPTPKRVALTAQERARYAGSYALHLPSGQVLAVEVSVRDTTLMAHPQGETAFELIPFGDHTFGAAFDPTLRVTFALKGGRVTGFTLLQHGTKSEAQRKP